MKAGSERPAGSGAGRRCSNPPTGAVDLELGPAAPSFTSSSTQSRSRRIAYEPENPSPTARAVGESPTTVSHRWGCCSMPPAPPTPTPAISSPSPGISTGTANSTTRPRATPTRTFAVHGFYHPAVRVSDRDRRLFGGHERPSTSGTPPIPVIESPSPESSFAANEPFTFSGSAHDAKDGELSADRLNWSAVLNHCTEDGGCHRAPHRELHGRCGWRAGHACPRAAVPPDVDADGDGLGRAQDFNVSGYLSLPQRAAGAIDRPASDRRRLFGGRTCLLLRRRDRPGGREPARQRPPLAADV